MHKEKRQRAESLRHQGKTYPEIEKILGVSRSTLSYWLHALPLSATVRNELLLRKKQTLIHTRHKAILANKRLAREKQKDAEQWSFTTLASSPLKGDTRALLLAMLYLGEGFKRSGCIGLGNSNPKILRAFINLLRSTFDIDETKFRCFLHLRADQNDKKEKDFWSNTLSIALDKFRKSQHDQRTLGKKTWISYHGVCAVLYYDASIEKKLSALQIALMDKILTGS